MVVVSLGAVAVLAVIVSILIARDRLAASEHQADLPPGLTEEPLTSPHGATAGDTPEGEPRVIGTTEADVGLVPFIPAHIFIPEAGVNTSVQSAPSSTEFNRFLGRDVLTFPVPDDAFTTVWWDEGATPGGGGLAVILGHARAPRAAVFNELPGLNEGATVGLTGRTPEDEDVTARYRVEQVVTGISKTDAGALRAVLDNPPAGATLALITCSGPIDEVLSSRVDNTVVFATLTGVHPNA